MCSGRRQTRLTSGRRKEPRRNFWLTLRKRRRRRRRFFQEDRKASGGPSAWRDVRRESYSATTTTTTVTTTHITLHTLDDVWEEPIHWGPPGRHDVSITTDLSQHAHRIRFARAIAKRDQLIDRSPIPIVSSRGEVEGESKNAPVVERIIGGFVVVI